MTPNIEIMARPGASQDRFWARWDEWTPFALEAMGIDPATAAYPPR